MNQLGGIERLCGDEQIVPRLHAVHGELRHLPLGNHKLELVQDVADHSVLKEHRSEIVPVHHHVDARVHHSAPVRLTARGLVGHHEPNHENRGVVVQVQKGNLMVVLLEHHQKCVTELRELADVKQPNELRHAPVVSVASADRVVPQSVARRNGSDHDAKRHVRGQRKQKGIVDQSEEAELLLSEQLTNWVQHCQRHHVRNDGKEDVRGGHQREALGVVVAVFVKEGIKGSHDLRGIRVQCLIKRDDGRANHVKRLRGHHLYNSVR
mmetsp:Transcript_59226/g.68556  ORF Transcript_59226/g.68556 Transcript_59226/m.68556 type:complete len:266 (+) Transcript_59226:493-1290(+)